MATTPKHSANGAGQGTISFARRSRRPGAVSAPSKRTSKAKVDLETARQGVTRRVQSEEEKQAGENKLNEPAKGTELKSIDEILNGNDSQALLAELRKDCLGFPRFHQENMSVVQQLLRQFDMISEYGPCQGLTRMQRWNRANRLGRKPPAHIKDILEAAMKTPTYHEEYEMSVFGHLGS